MNISQAPQPISSDGGTIAYTERGHGPFVVCVPGMGELASSFSAFAELLAAKGYRVVTADLRGHGDSSADFASYGDLETARDIAAIIRHLGAPAVIVGNSLAAGSAVIVAADHPELVSGLVLTGPFVRNPKANPVLMFIFRAMTARPWAATVWKSYLPSLYAGTKPGNLTEHVAAVAASIKRPGYARAFSLTTRTDHAPAEAALPRVSAPALVVMGVLDPDFAKPVAEAEWIRDALGAELLLVDDAGHYPHAQHPQLVAEAVDSFIEGRVNA